MQETSLQILVTNDDGYTSNGIKTIANLLTKYGDVTVIAPQEAQSGKSASVTLDLPLRLSNILEKDYANGHKLRVFSLTGTPVDCVKMAMNIIYKNSKPDILVSGINHGSNASVASVYSGTLGATAEGAIYDIPSIGVSMNSHDPNADMSVVEQFFPKILENVIKYPPKKGVYLNINFPDIKPNEVKGIKFAAQGNGMWIKEVVGQKDPRGTEHFWMCGEFKDLENREIGDHKLLDKGYITIVPHKIDTTDYNEIEELSNKWTL
jgi:5''/3''-nucleotidase SurE